MNDRESSATSTLTELMDSRGLDKALPPAEARRWARLAARLCRGSVGFIELGLSGEIVSYARLTSMQSAVASDSTRLAIERVQPVIFAYDLWRAVDRDRTTALAAMVMPILSPNGGEVLGAVGVLDVSTTGSEEHMDNLVVLAAAYAECCG